MSTPRNRRILLIDDMPSIHEDFRKILAPSAFTQTALDSVEDALFGDTPKLGSSNFELDSAYQGAEGLAKVSAALQANRPYAMAFVDARMPPGWDGVQTIEHLWRADPRLQVVICTAFSDHSWEEVQERLDVRDRLLILKKPFDAIEVCQLANSLTAKWDMTQQAVAQFSRLEAAVRERTAEITRSNEMLQAEIVERKHLQSQLVQQEKLVSIGQLAAGVAHEINNPIAYVYSNFGTLEGYLAKLFEMLAAYENAERHVGALDVAVQLRTLREQLELEFLKSDIRELIGESKQGIVQVRQIVQHLKDFSRVDSAGEWQWANLHESIDSTLNVLASEIQHRADVIKAYGEIPEIECLPSQINQVVMNLLVNAAHAMGEARGCITLRTGVSRGPQGDQVWLEVADNGSGIQEETLKRIFEPFFTTKPVNQGSGLGLSVSHGIVQKHQGRLDVESVVGQGTTFRVTLPVRHLAPQVEVKPVP